MTAEKTVRLKGRGNGLCLLIPAEISEDEAVGASRRILAEANRFDTPVTVGLGNRSAGAGFVSRLCSEALWPSGARVLEWICDDPETSSAVSKCGMRVRGMNAAASGSGRTVSGTLRGGSMISHPGDVVIEGDIHPGAEVAAGGSIFVTGKMTGVVHAGCEGNDDAIVVAGQFLSDQVRIGGLVGRVDKSGPWWGKPVIVMVSDGGDIEIRELPA